MRAYWHDPKRAKRRGVLVGQSGNAKRMRDSFANEADAHAAAIAEWRRIQRGATTFELTLALGVPALAPQTADRRPQTAVRVSGFKPQIDDTEWLSIRVTHCVDDAGYTTRLELESGDVSRAESPAIDDSGTDLT